MRTSIANSPVSLDLGTSTSTPREPVAGSHVLEVADAARSPSSPTFPTATATCAAQGTSLNTLSTTSVGGSLHAPIISAPPARSAAHRRYRRTPLRAHTQPLTSA